MNCEWMLPTLYTPATINPEKLLLLMQGRAEHVRRMVIDTEDSVAESDVPQAILNVMAALRHYKPDACSVFIRPRNDTILGMLLGAPGITATAGFVIPKASPRSFPQIADEILACSNNFEIMPILESRHIPNADFRKALAEAFESYRSNIPCLRIGVNDLLGHQGLRRDDYRLTIYDSLIRGIIEDIVNEFRGLHGYNITAPVFEIIDNCKDYLLREEVRMHVVNGLYGQTVIHPRHLPILAYTYRVTGDELASAQAMVGNPSQAVAKRSGRMDEPATQTGWALSIIGRAQVFGVSSGPLKDKKL